MRMKFEMGDDLNQFLNLKFSLYKNYLNGTPKKVKYVQICFDFPE